MKNVSLKLTLVITFVFICGFGFSQLGEKTKVKKPKFTFTFLTDIHLTPERNAVEGFRKAIDEVNKINPDFVITGGDQIMDALKQPYDTAKMLYDLYIEEAKRFKMPVYNTMGNHEVFGIYLKKDHPFIAINPNFSEKMFENRIGERYYSFNHKSWHFITLDAIEETEDNKYIGGIDSVQKEWIKNDLEKIDKNTPIVVSVHIPFVTVWTQLKYGVMKGNEKSIVITNGNEILNLFEGYNLKIVLQGHLHYLEDLYADGTHFITGGAVSSRWWRGPNDGLQEGFVKIDVYEDNSFDWKYIDFGWDGENMKADEN